jgi:hypothetical protein
MTTTRTAFLHGIGLIELSLGLALVIGFLRKTVYLCGIVLSLMIWSIVEGFGGPYGPGSTDVGAAIMYAFIFVAIIIVERSSNYSKYSLDALIERELSGRKHLAELYKDPATIKVFSDSSKNPEDVEKDTPEENSVTVIEASSEGARA